MKNLVLGFLLTLSTIGLFAQNVNVTGKVTDETGAPLAGVTVKVKGTSKGTQTNNDGSFQIAATSGATLTFSYVGYNNLDKKLSDGSPLTIALTKSSSSLDEVVVIGYQSVRRKDVLASVASISAKDLKDIPLTSAAEALNGRLAGVTASTAEGSPDAAIRIRVRGGMSITGDNSPLYILDGVQVENALSLIAPQDIQSVDVLKDAAATAIYGARGANGVIVITTKKGRQGKMQVTYNAFYGVKDLAKKLEVLSPYEYGVYQYERAIGNATDSATFVKNFGSFLGLESLKSVTPINWQSEVFGKQGISKSHNLSIVGGSKKLTYNFGVTTNDDKAIVKNSNFKRGIITGKLEYTPIQNLKIGLSTRYNYQEVMGAGISSDQGTSYNRLRNTIRYKPYLSPSQGIEDADPAAEASVGKVTTNVLAGARMSTDNLHHASEPYVFKPYDYQWTAPDISKFAGRTFNGYHRADGRVGTANYWLFIPTVFCENRNLDVIKEALHNELGYSVSNQYKNYTKDLINAFKEGKDISEAVSLAPNNLTNKRVFENIDGIKFLNHQGGCGGIRQDAAVLSKLLAAYADHPNVAGITVLSLGCQNLQLSDFEKDIKERNPNFNKPLYIFEQQKSLSEPELIASAIQATFKGLIEANKQKRAPASLDNLCLGVKCGGSDGFSGISANPAVGYCADLLVGLGGTVLLAEFPELCGVEQELINRTIHPDAANKFIHLMKSYAESALQVGSGFHMNPSPGNIKDGLITDAIKSAGAAKKGGNSPIVDVLDYTEPATKKGLNLVCTPGNDVEATTGKAAAGATLILFTTGLGTPTGNPVCPTIKVSSNTALAKRMADIIDIDTGPVIEGEKTIEQMGEAILEYCIKAASGEVTPKAVLLNQDDFIPWKRGVSL